MTANEWLGVIKQASDFPQGMEKLILKYGEMLIKEHESKVKKITIPDVSNRRELLFAFLKANENLTIPDYDSNKHLMIDAFLCKQ